MSNDNDSSIPMTSNRPYLLRAIYDWISDNNLTPYVLVDAAADGVRVPPQTVRNGQVVLNLAMHAVADLDLGNEWVSCKARFSGVSHSIMLPIGAVQAIYAQENGQGMMFADEGDTPPAPPSPPSPPEGEPPTSEGDAPRPARRGAPHLKVVK